MESKASSSKFVDEKTFLDAVAQIERREKSIQSLSKNPDDKIESKMYRAITELTVKEVEMMLFSAITFCGFYFDSGTL